MNRNPMRIWMLSALTLSLALPMALQAETPLRVGVLEGSSHETLAAAVDAQPDMTVTVFGRITPAALAKLDVLLVTQSQNPALLMRSGLALRRWIESGKGAMLFHDAVGYRAHIPMFREIGMGVQYETQNRLRPAKDHPVLAGLDPEAEFVPAFQFDHISMEAGPSGDVLLVNPAGTAGLIAGSLKEGRVLLNGMLTGGEGPPDRSFATPAEPEGSELKVLLNGIRWLGGR